MQFCSLCFASPYNICTHQFVYIVDEGRGEPGADEPRTGPADLRGGRAGAAAATQLHSPGLDLTMRPAYTESPEIGLVNAFTWPLPLPDRVGTRKTNLSVAGAHPAEGHRSSATAPNTYGNAAAASERPYLGALEPRLVASPSKVLPARSRTCDRSALTAGACCAACRQPTVDGGRGSPGRGLDGLW